MPLAISATLPRRKRTTTSVIIPVVQESIKRLASGRGLTSPVQDPGNLAVSMKLSASLNRLSGAMNNAQNGISFLEGSQGWDSKRWADVDRMSEQGACQSGSDEK